MNTCWKVVTRKKVLDASLVTETRLARVLNTYDLTALGVGSTLGVGVYVLAGHLARDTAGPSVVLSFLIAAIASVFAGLCYAEFGARVPKAGSAYIYSYVCVGELVAFVIGWNLILEYVIGSASVARGLSLYLDTLLNDTLKDTFREIAPINIDFMSPYFDFFTFGLSLVLSVGLAFGMKESSIVNNIFTILNIAVVLFVIIAGSIKADTENWHLPPPNSTVYPKGGDGGFFPFGVEGMIKGAATCFYGFVGFDCIATTGEEVKNPKRAIPLSIIFSLAIIFLAYFGTSTVITLMVPYYMQDVNAPIPAAFESIGWTTAKWLVAIGGIFGLFASLFGAMFPLPRIIYAMATDGLVFKFLGDVSPRFQTPVVGTLLAGLLTGLMGALFDLKQLVNMMSIGTLLAYTIVAGCVLLLRFTMDSDGYQPLPLVTEPNDTENYVESRPFYNETITNTDLYSTEESYPSYADERVTFWSIIKQIFNCGRRSAPSKASEKIVITEIFIYCILCLCLGFCGIFLVDKIAHGYLWAIVLTSVIGGLMLLILMSIATQPTSNAPLSFKVPLVPLIPALSILCNIYLMLMLDINTWIRFGVWMAIGLPIYYFSVRLYPKIARNPNSIRTPINGTTTISTNGGVANGHINHAFINDKDAIVENGKEPTPHAPLKKKKPAPPPPESPELNQALKALDDVLSSDSVYGRPVSGESGFNSEACEENVVALVHRADSSIIDKEHIASVEEMFLSDDLVSISVIENENRNVNPVEQLVHLQKSSDEGKDNKDLVAAAEESTLISSSSEVNTKIEVEPIYLESTNQELPPTPLQQEEKPSTPPPSPPPPPPLPPVEQIPLPPPLPTNDVKTSINQNGIMPPPPPLPTNDFNSNGNHEEPMPSPPPLPLMSLRKTAVLPSPSPLIQEVKEFEKVALKPVKGVSNTTSKELEEPPPDNHLRFGTKQHEHFKRKLEGVFQQNVQPERTRPVTVHGNSFVRNEDGQRKQVKNIVANLKTEPNTEAERTASFRDVKSKFERTLNINPVKLEHSKRMASTLQSIRSRRARTMLLQ